MNEKGANAHADKDKDAFGADDGGDGEDGDEDGDDGKKGFGRGKGRMEKADDGQEKATVKRPVEILSDIEIATLQVKSHRAPVSDNDDSRSMHSRHCPVFALKCMFLV
jgi:hypothetical protein